MGLLLRLHSTRNFAAICRDAKLDTAAMEKLVFAIIEATVLDWRLDDTWRNSEVVDDIPL